MKRPCPTCGRPVGRRAKVCDYCGRDLTGGLANPPTPQTSAGAPSPPIPQPGPFSSPTGVVPVLGRTTKTIIVFVLAAGIIAGAVFLFFFLTKQVRRGIDTVAGKTASPPAIVVPTEGGKGGKDDKGGGSNGGGSGGAGSGDQSQEFKGARAVFDEMLANGAKCKNFDVVIDTDIVSAATCFAGLEPWTIQVFFDDVSYDAVVSNYVSSDSLHVAYGGNWTVLTGSKSSSRKIAKALGGKAT